MQRGSNNLEKNGAVQDASKSPVPYFKGAPIFILVLDYRQHTFIWDKTLSKKAFTEKVFKKKLLVFNSIVYIV